MAKISVVSPIFREEGTLRELYRRLRAMLSSITEDFEIVLVSDGGFDCSWDIICELSAKDPRVKGVKFTRNFGQHVAVPSSAEFLRFGFVSSLTG